MLSNKIKGQSYHLCWNEEEDEKEQLKGGSVEKGERHHEKEEI